MRRSLWPHRLALGLTAATLALIFIGGLVTTTHSGLAVPDWPLSYGRFFLPMTGGILFEHGHRLVAATIGFLTLLLAIFLTLKDSRSWVKKWGWTAVGFVILQGIFGGMTVLFKLPPLISIIHACMAQTFLCLVVALTVWTSPTWIKKGEPAPLSEEGRIPLHQLSVILFGVLFLQLVLGAILRHTGWGILLHITGAILVALCAAWIYKDVGTYHHGLTSIRPFSLAIIVVVGIQILLGFMSFLFLTTSSGPVNTPFRFVALITSHVFFGALLLGLSMILVLFTLPYKSLRPLGAKRKISDYFTLTKPGITTMAGATALTGYVLGSGTTINFLQLFHTVVGTLLVSAGAGTLNMLIEKDVDAKMKRTQTRPLPSGRLQSGEVLLFGTLLAVFGISYLSWAVNLLTGFLAGLTLCVYLYVYTPLKKHSFLCITIGAIAGALPPVLGWAAARGTLGIGALILFGIIFFWQFPHFLSLAWIYKEDYKQAGLHMLPSYGQSDNATAHQIIITSVGLLSVSLLPTFFKMSGWIYLLSALFLGVILTTLSIQFFKDRSRTNARKLFFASLAYVPLLITVLILNKLPQTL